MGAWRVGAVLLAVVALWGCSESSNDAGVQVGAAAAEQGSAAPRGEGGEAGNAAPEGSAGPPAPSPSTPCESVDSEPAIPEESTPPTMAGDMEPGQVPNGPLSEERVPQFGELIIQVEAQSCQEYSAEFRADQRVLMHTHADDGNYSDIQVYGPDGRRIAEWQTGQPGTVEGADFYNDDWMPADGTYVFRVIHREGSATPFVIAFYGQG
jgi:hypothetical protein